MRRHPWLDRVLDWLAGHFTTWPADEFARFTRSAPPEASALISALPPVSACSHLTAGAACTIAAGGKTLNGFCHQLPNGGPLVCLPPPPSPPQETIDACSGHAAGAACSVTFNGHTISGACATLPDGTTHACAPVCHGS